MKRIVKMLIVYLLSFCLILPEFSIPIYANEMANDLETTFSEETQHLEINISDKVLQAGGLLDCGTSLRNSQVSFFTTKDNTANAEIKAMLISAFLSYEAVIDVAKYKVSKEKVTDIFSEIINQNPRFFYVNDFFSLYCDSRGNVISVYVYYLYDEKTSMEMLDKFDQAISLATSKVSSEWSDLEKALYINDYLAQNCEYDLSYSRYSAYDALVNKTAVCQGYALAFQALAQELGLQSELVTSRSLNHAWNMVQINDEFYNIDVTWNDPIKDRLGRARHYYFMKSTAYFKSAETEHFNEDDWIVTGDWEAEYASNIRYDEYFWNLIDCGFSYVNGYWYNFDGTNKIVKYSCNGSEFNQIEKIMDITDYWHLVNSTAVYNDKYVGTGSYGGVFYYSTDDSIFAINTIDNTVSKIFQLSDSQILSGGYIYGMNVSPYGEIYYYQTPDLNTRGSIEKVAYLDEDVIRYHIVFSGNGATSGKMIDFSDRIYGNTYRLPGNVFVRKGYTFIGWNTKADGSGISYADQASVKNLTSTNEDTVILYAQWKEKTYNIFYNLNGGENNINNPSAYTSLTATIELKDPKKTGYTFKGWYSDEKYTKQVKTIKKGSSGTKTLYAKWSANKYIISFKGNGSTSGSMKKMSDCKYETKYTLKANAFKKTGYTFDGWNTKANGSGDAYKDKVSVRKLSAKNGSTVTLYAQWKLNEYKITYKLSDGKNNSANPKNYTVADATITLKNPTKEGYKFVGWYSDSKFKKKVKSIKKGSTGNITLYAKWRKK